MQALSEMVQNFEMKFGRVPLSPVTLTKEFE